MMRLPRGKTPWSQGVPGLARRKTVTLLDDTRDALAAVRSVKIESRAPRPRTMKVHLAHLMEPIGNRARGLYRCVEKGCGIRVTSRRLESHGKVLQSANNVVWIEEG
jgi:hypothetical protein